MTLTTDTSGWAGLFRDAFRRSLNAMVLTDDQRILVDVNPAFERLLDRPRRALVGHHLYDLVEGGAWATGSEWRAALARDETTGEAGLLRSDGGVVRVQFAAYPEKVTAQRLVLFVALRISRAGRHFRKEADVEPSGGELTVRELEVARLIALGASGPEIAEELSISHNTVRAHAQKAMTKVGARSRAHLVAKVLGEGMVLPK
jgi:PAS domain S-box-containing protein